MPQIQLPEGRYFSLTKVVRATSGGQTRALLMRNRLFAQRAGITPTVLTFDSSPRYSEFRAGLRAQGQLVEPMALLNIFEWYREHGVDHLEPIGDALADVTRYDAVDEKHPDGTVHRTRYRDPRTQQEALRDYRRPDGSVYARILAGSTGMKDERSDLTPVTLVNRRGQPVLTWSTPDGWHQHWIDELTPPGETAFVICDSRWELPFVVGLPRDRFHLIHVIHNVHTAGEYKWNSPIKAAYLPVFDAIGRLDGLVTLTSRQREDIAARFGATDNLFVVPNPVEPPERPDPLPVRDPKRFSIVTRLEHQKQLQHALRAFALVLKEEPDATLDVYGAGTERAALEEEIAALGIQDSVTMRGHDPRARESLWTATGFLMSSLFEGYPLATLESMSHGCPVISYDIKYGPREQITHGVDGFLVEDGDTQGMADRAVELIRNPELVAKMSQAALDKAAKHDHATFLDDWRNVLETVVAAKETRTSLESVTLSLTRSGHLGPLPVPARLMRNRAIGRIGRSSPRQVTFGARLDVAGHSTGATLESAVVTLEALGGGRITAVPLEVNRSGSTFRLAATLGQADLFRDMDDKTKSVRLRLRLVWENSSWQATL